MLRASLLFQRTSVVGARRMPSAFQPHRFASTKASSANGGFFKSAWTSYSRLLETKPVTTKVVTACTIAGLGDVTCQFIIEKSDKLDVKRTAIFTFLGGVVVAPILHVWYRFMSTTIPGLGTQAVLKRLAMDQLGFAPTFLPIFFTMLLTLEGVPETIPEKVRTEWWPTTKANWVVWVPAQLINFRFVPGNLQVLFANFVGFFWNSYLSYVSHATTPKIEAILEDAGHADHIGHDGHAGHLEHAQS
ncbi:hypothetical protein Poli38472_010267 [Pythium oligandrum]|uniref:Uncharacterized protein n=1 Tax=Pythium oligandrum TaxID=41045 RepID=A0A8K1FHE6_PYTOL|nr:hypothetical protein Poli38472_010267 [Pythium oligandrum]|eukprot:TMW58708.1 hypothetical protein Poli38472_010267 [Pythium oligandrum]